MLSIESRIKKKRKTMLLSLRINPPSHKHTCLGTLFHTDAKGCISLKNAKASLPGARVESWHFRLMKRDRSPNKKDLGQGRVTAPALGLDLSKII